MTYHKKYREENKEALTEYKKEYNKAYYKENKEVIAEYNKKYRKENRESLVAYHRRVPEVSQLSRAKKRAEDKNLPFNIDIQYLRDIWPKDNTCPALGIKFIRGEGKPVDSSPSLDRIIPKLGYVKGNVQIVCNLTNQIISNATPDQVIKVGEYFKKITEKKNAA